MFVCVVVLGVVVVVVCCIHCFVIYISPTSPPGLPLDGVNQWQMITGQVPANTTLRDSIFHNIAPVSKVTPVNVGNTSHPVGTPQSVRRRNAQPTNQPTNLFG